MVNMDGSDASDEASGAAAPVVAPPVVDTRGRVCLRCGYDLSGLQATGVCPECGTPVAHSLHGNLLLYSAPEFLKKLHRGVFLILAAIIVMFVAMMGAIALEFITAAGVLLPEWEAVADLAGVASSLGIMAGWWLLSEPDPAFIGRDDGGRARRLVRITVAVAASLTLAVFIVEQAAPAGNPASDGLEVAGSIAGLIAVAVHYFASMVYIQWLARRIPDEYVLRRSRLLMWLGPLLYFPGCVILIGPLIGLVLYWNLLDHIRKQLKRIRAEQASMGLATGAGGALGLSSQ
jgi:hypothetical protein